ncbi:MAG: YebC/PmpR family DNA-binding transcriptional regulator [Planctomycetota bacterium]
MAGHSKWANIKHKKAAIDKKRAKVWGKIARKIMVAAKGGSDPRDNLSLRYIVDEAKAANMPKNTIENAIAKGAGETGTENFEEIVYEGYGPAGVAMLVDVLTDNRNRTAGEIRNMFDRAGGNLGTSGSVAFQFEKQGVFAISSEQADEEKLIDVAVEAGADDVQHDDGMFVVLTPASEYGSVRDALNKADIETESAEISNVAQNTVELDEDNARKVLKLVDMLEDNDDVQSVSHNAEIPEAALADV